MSLLWILLVAFCVVLFIAALLAAALFSPVVVTVDSRNRRVRVRWLAMLEYLWPLPGAEGETRLRIAGRNVRFRQRGPKKERKRAEVRARVPRRASASAAQFFFRCLGDSSIRRDLAKQLGGLWKGVLRSAVVTRCRSGLSLTDPALNGMLAGALAHSGWGRRLGIRVNFTGENSLFLEIRFHPHRIVKAFLSFLSGLPYRAIFRAWRASFAMMRRSEH